MARRTVYVPLICLLLFLGVFWNLPRAQGAIYSDQTEIRHKQVVFYLVALNVNDSFSINCSTYFNSSIKAYLLTQRPTEDVVNASFVNVSATADNQNHTTLSMVSNVTKIFYVEIIQQDDKTDFLLVNASVSPDKPDFALTRYYIPFIAGYPLIETLLALTAAIFILQRAYKRGKK